MSTQHEMPPYHLDDESNTRMDMRTAAPMNPTSKKKSLTPKDEIKSVAKSIMLSANVAAGDRLEALRVYGRLHGINVDAVGNEKGNASVLTED